MKILPCALMLSGLLACNPATSVAQGVSYDRFSNDELMTMQQYNLFPNVSLVIFPDLLTVLRSRPGARAPDGPTE